ncbi:MAG: AAA family ATPase [Leptolyngbyaceae cyanobacterium MO_188.B28]|nr:AAA family ATPase [Leptolyngbyaceae cyanobacterium MO_188.B28]
MCKEGNLHLKGFGFSGYRSFGDELTKIAPLRKVNLIIGQNNIGKSNIIKFINDQYAYFANKARNQRQISRQQEITFKTIDKHLSQNRADHRISFPIFRNEIDEYIDKKFPDVSRDSDKKKLTKKLLSSELLTDENGDVWFTYKSSSYTGEFTFDFSTDEILSALEHNEWRFLWSALTRKRQGDLRQNWIPDTLHGLCELENCEKRRGDAKIIW